MPRSSLPAAARRIARLAALSTVLATAAADASSLRISPLLVNLGGKQPTAQLEVHNDGATDTAVDARILAWSQPQGKDVLSATDDVAVVPPVFRVAAGKRQVVRVGVVNRALRDPRERSYRLVLTELPQAGPADNQLRFQMRVLIPVFLTTVERARSILSMRLRVDGEQLFLDASNAGNGHAKITSVTLRDRGGKPLSSQSVMGYVLPGAAMSLSVPGRIPTAPIAKAEAQVLGAGQAQAQSMSIAVP